MRPRSPTLFWRTFLLIVALIVACLLAWLQSFRVLEREPRARQIAQQVVSIVTLTRGALLYSDPLTRLDLLTHLAENEGIRIVPLEPGDQVEPFPDVPVIRLASRRVIEQLGSGTRLAERVNGVPGIWVSFSIDGDAYWVLIERDPLARQTGTQWLIWAVAALLLSLLAAVLITRVLNRPLKALSDAALQLGGGRVPTPLPGHGPAEIRRVNASFNRMVNDLAKLEQDRAVLLAGISHDLRTPLTRLRLELDINDMPPETRAAMIADIEQIDAIVRQFLDYARREPQQPRTPVDLSRLLRERLEASRLAERGDSDVVVSIAPGATVPGHRTELARVIDNLLTNADRYGRDPDSGRLALAVALTVNANAIELSVADEGSGIGADQLDRLRRPFERGDDARGGLGAGLGLAIVERIAALHGGQLVLGPNAPRGLRARVRLPLAG